MLYKPIFYYSVISNNIGDKAIRKVITEKLLSYINVPINLIDVREELTYNRIVSQINDEISSIIIAGGGLYSNCPNTKSGWYFNCDIKNYDHIKVPIILLGIGSNNHLVQDQFGHLQQKTLDNIRKINQKSIISTVRDLRTYNLLKSMGINHHILSLDPACFLSLKNSVSKSDIVLIQIAQHAPSLGVWYSNNKYYRNKNLEQIKIICEYLKGLGLKPIIIAFDPLEQSFIIDLNKKIEVDFINTIDIDEILKYYSSALFTIGSKMHSNIFSFATGTPFISLYYDVKSIEFLKLIKWNFGISIYEDYVEFVKNSINDILKNLDYYSNYLKYIKSKAEIKFNNIMYTVSNIIKNTNISLNVNFNKENDKISVLMPVYNRKSYVKEAIESILNQTYRNFIFLIYDDGSTDGTTDILEYYKSLDNRIKLLKNNINMGGLYGKKILLENCETLIACWMDSDDVSLPTRLEKQLDYVLKYGLVFTDWLYLELKNNNLWIPTYKTSAINLSSAMFLVNKQINIDVEYNKMWGSSSWFGKIKIEFPLWKIYPEVLYYIRLHPYRITNLKKFAEKNNINCNNTKELLKLYEKFKNS